MQRNQFGTWRNDAQIIIRISSKDTRLNQHFVPLTLTYVFHNYESLVLFKAAADLIWNRNLLEYSHFKLYY